ncbi:hypothetical protein BS17DRAFT_827727 [Gyrodon lividus]|nr:hypothetical protein BS17DRAFT_827727 [Gyrodon lividus]
MTKDATRRFVCTIGSESEVVDRIARIRTFGLGGADSAERAVEYLDIGEYSKVVARLVPGSVSWGGKLLVRKEYHLAMEAFEEGYKTGAYIVGQLGIVGKSYFLLYALVERLRKKQLVAFQFRADTYIFSRRLESLSTLRDQTFLRMRVTYQYGHSPTRMQIPPSQRLLFHLPLVSACFKQPLPNVSRWKEWSKQAGVKPYIMDVWSIEETADLGSLLGLDVERMTAFSTAWGGVPRMLLDLFDSPASESDFESKISVAATHAIASAPTFIPTLKQLNIENTGPSCIFIKPRQDSNGCIYRRQPIVYVPTPRIVDILATTLRHHDAHVKTSFFTIMESHSTTCGSAGAIYECWFNSLFCSGESIEYRWHGENIPHTLQLPIRLACTNDELKNTALPFYWIPSNTNFPGIDGVTLAYDHPTPHQLQALLPEAKKALRWKVLFVGPNEAQVLKASNKWSRKLTIGTPHRRTSVPVGWCALDPIASDITYIICTSQCEAGVPGSNLWN